MEYASTSIQMEMMQLGILKRIRNSYLMVITTENKNLYLLIEFRNINFLKLLNKSLRMH